MQRPVNTMRKESAEGNEEMAADVPARTSVHCLDRVLATPTERVRACLLDPQIRSRWDSRPPEAHRELNVLPNGELVRMESEQGISFTTRISVIEHGACSSVIRVQLVPHQPHDVMAIYKLGIDDLWEDRLYVITDLLLGFSTLNGEHRTISHLPPRHDQA